MSEYEYGLFRLDGWVSPARSLEDAQQKVTNYVRQATLEGVTTPPPIIVRRARATEWEVCDVPDGS